MIPAIEALRGLAILLVLTYHVWERTHWSIVPVFSQSGYLGVELFFFVSGFCLMLPYARGEWTLGHYISRRALKIVPSYYLALAVAAVFPFDGGGGAWDTLVHATFLHGLSAATFVSMNGNFWSLAVEIEFYLVFPLLAALVLRRPLWLAVVFIGWLGYVMTIPPTFLATYQLPAELPLFLAGMLVAKAYVAGGRIPWLGAIALMLTGALVFFACCLALQSCAGPCSWHWRSQHGVELGAAFALIALGLLALPYRGDPFTRFYGNISYNVYLWNALIVAIFPSLPIVVIALSTAIGWALTFGFERPIMRLRRSSWNPVRHRRARSAQP